VCKDKVRYTLDVSKIILPRKDLPHLRDLESLMETSDIFVT
jgi:hypothetical protein